MEIINILGYLASFLVFATFYVKRIMTLRVIAIASNVAFILYAIGDNLLPILILHSLLLPLNLYRIYELRKNIKAFSAPNQFDIKGIEAYAQKKKFKKGDIIFQQGAESLCIYFLKSGSVKEYSEDSSHWDTKVLKGGDAFGLLSYFSPSRKTFFKAQALEDSIVYAISHDRLSEVCLQSPRFGFLLMNWLASRLESQLLYRGSLNKSI